MRLLWFIVNDVNLLGVRSCDFLNSMSLVLLQLTWRLFVSHQLMKFLTAVSTVKMGLWSSVISKNTSQTYLNAGFLMPVDPKRNFSIRDKPRIVFGGIHPSFVCEYKKKQKYKHSIQIFYPHTIGACNKNWAQSVREIFEHNFIKKCTHYFGKRGWTQLHTPECIPSIQKGTGWSFVLQSMVKRVYFSS